MPCISRGMMRGGRREVYGKRCMSVSERVVGIRRIRCARGRQSWGHAGTSGGRRGTLPGECRLKAGCEETAAGMRGSPPIILASGAEADSLGRGVELTRGSCWGVRGEDDWAQPRLVRVRWGRGLRAEGTEADTGRNRLGA